MLNLPSNNEELSLLKFMGKYQYINVNDLKYFFKQNTYFKKRITNLLKNKYIKKIDQCYILTEKGMKYIRMLNYECIKVSRKSSYVPRLLYISNIAAYYNNCDTVSFIPSYELKDKEQYTTTSRRYIGILNINGTKYLTYHISKKHDNKYISSVIFDINKEKIFQNIIILVDDITMINYQDFIFGYNQVIILEDTEENREKLKGMNSVNWDRIIHEEYKKPYLSGHIYCDYEDAKGNYISHFYFFDTEKINRINNFLNLNKEKYASIICSEELKQVLQKIFSKAFYTVIDLEKNIDGKRTIYYEYE